MLKILLMKLTRSSLYSLQLQIQYVLYHLILYMDYIITSRLCNLET
uniref:Uncharacterized protein n=1 Tax=viral metagenome TaxID=1070528 RepID=A0A6C0BLY9_9ZZZZ